MAWEPELENFTVLDRERKFESLGFVWDWEFRLWEPGLGQSSSEGGGISWVGSGQGIHRGGFWGNGLGQVHTRLLGKLNKNPSRQSLQYKL